MPAVGYGCWKVGKDNAADLIAKVIRLGYRHIDGACDYANEKEVGMGEDDVDRSRAEEERSSSRSGSSGMLEQEEDQDWKNASERLKELNADQFISFLELLFEHVCKTIECGLCVVSVSGLPLRLLCLIFWGQK